MKDKFSDKAKQYQYFRPNYPDTVYHFILNHCSCRNAAWDCGTGNGQIAIELVKYFESVYATDISLQQLQHAYIHEKIIYKMEAAESCSSPDHSFDLVTVGQAIHWFDFDQFYNQVNRTLKPGGIIAVIGYGLIKINRQVDPVISELYKNILGSYWDAERRFIDAHYKTIPFPYKEIQTPSFSIQLNWNFAQLLGYLYTWSAIGNFQKEHKEDPVQILFSKLQKAWGEKEQLIIQFPVFVRMGKHI